MADVMERLEKAERVETLAAELYRLLAQDLPADSNVRIVLLRLATEEDDHALRIRTLASRFEGRLHAVAYDTTALDELINEAVALKSLVAGSPHDQRDLLRFMIEQERRFGIAHAHVLAEDDPEIAAFFVDLASRDQMHLRVLEALEKK